MLALLALACLAAMAAYAMWKYASRQTTTSADEEQWTQGATVATVATVYGNINLSACPTLQPDTQLRIQRAICGSDCAATVIVLHGLGDSGPGWYGHVRRTLQRGPVLQATRFILPLANRRCVTALGNVLLPAWFDVLSMDPHGREDETGVRDACQRVRDLIRLEMERGVPPSSIALLGFSQGGAVALATALTSEVPLAGVVALSAYLPARSFVQAHATATGLAIPIVRGNLCAWPPCVCGRSHILCWATFWGAWLRAWRRCNIMAMATRSCRLRMASRRRVCCELWAPLSSSARCVASGMAPRRTSCSTCITLLNRASPRLWRQQSCAASALRRHS